MRRLWVVAGVLFFALITIVTINFFLNKNAALAQVGGETAAVPIYTETFDSAMPGECKTDAEHGWTIYHPFQPNWNLFKPSTLMPNGGPSCEWAVTDNESDPTPEWPTGISGPEFLQSPHFNITPCLTDVGPVLLEFNAYVNLPTLTNGTPSNAYLGVEIFDSSQPPGYEWIEIQRIQQDIPARYLYRFDVTQYKSDDFAWRFAARETFGQPPTEGAYIDDSTLKCVWPSELSFDDGIFEYEPETVVSQGENFDLLVDHAPETTVSVSILDLNITLTLLRTIFSDNWSTTYVRFFVPANASEGAKLVTVTTTYPGNTSVTTTRNTTVRFDITATDGNNTITDKERQFWVNGSYVTVYNGGNTSSGFNYTIYVTNARIVNLVNSIVGGETDPEKAANKKRQWLSDHADWDDGSLGTICYGDTKDFLDGIEGAAPGTKATYQCSDACAMLVNMLRAEGIPARAVTGTDFKSGWNYHCWVEANFGSGWKAMDATSDDSPVTSPDLTGDGQPDMDVDQDAVDPMTYWNNNFPGDGQAQIWTTDPDTGQPIDITSSYHSTLGPPPVCDVTIAVSTDMASYVVGENVTIFIDLNNTGSQIEMLEINSLTQRFAAVGDFFMDVNEYVLNDTDIVILTPAGMPGSTTTLTKMLTKSNYEENGDYHNFVTSNESVGTDPCFGESFFDIFARIDLMVSHPSEVAPGGSIDEIISVTNTGPDTLFNVNIQSRTPHYSSQPDINYTIDSLLAGQTNTSTFPQNMGFYGDFNYHTFADSGDGDFEFQSEGIRSQRLEEIMIRNDGLLKKSVAEGDVIRATVFNPSDFVLTNVTAELFLQEGMKLPKQAGDFKQNVGDLQPGESAIVEWNVTYTSTGPLSYEVQAYDANNSVFDFNGELVDPRFQMPLPAGWNHISSPLRPFNPNIPDFLQSINGSYDVLFYFNSTKGNGTWQNYNVNKPPFLNTFKEVNEKIGFWIHMLQPGALDIEGEVVDQAIFHEMVNPSFNELGHPHLQQLNITDALFGVDSTYEVVWEHDANNITEPWKYFDPDNPDMSTLKFLTPGLGYWVDGAKDRPVTWQTDTANLNNNLYFWNEFGECGGEVGGAGGHGTRGTPHSNVSGTLHVFGIRNVSQHTNTTPSDGLGNVSCGPAAGTAVLRKLNETNGGIVNTSDDNTTHTLRGKMMTAQPGGSRADKVVDGLIWFLIDQGVNASRYNISWYWNTTRYAVLNNGTVIVVNGSVVYNSSNSNVTLHGRQPGVGDLINESVGRGELVIVLYQNATGNYNHYVVLEDVDTTQNADNSHNVSFMDPWGDGTPGSTGTDYGTMDGAGNINIAGSVVRMIVMITVSDLQQ